MKQNKLASFRPLLLVFIVLSGFFVAANNMLVRWNFDPDVLIIGNLILLIVTLLSFLLLFRGIQSPNPQSFVRAMYVSFIVKFFLIVLAAVIYIMIAKRNVNKPSLIACLFLYMVYTFLEISVLTKLLKQKKNA